MSDPNIEVVLTDDKTLHCFKVIFHIKVDEHPDREAVEMYLHATQAFDLFNKLGLSLLEYFAQTSAELLRKVYVSHEGRQLLEETFEMLQNSIAKDEPGALIAQMQKIGGFLAITTALDLKGGEVK